MTYPQTLTFKAQGFYVPCAPEAGAWSFGACFEEAVNGLTEQLRLGRKSPDSGRPGKETTDAVR